jgi:hypothetical protein
VLPGIAVLDLLLVQTDRQAVWLDAAEVYPSGVILTVVLHGRTPTRPGVGQSLGNWRFGVRFSSGQKAAVYGMGGMARLPEHGSWVSALAATTAPGPNEPVLRPLSGGGNRSRWRQRYWLWPLPPPGDLLCACEWPDRGMPLSTATIEAVALLDAATRARNLWPDDEPAG